MHPEQIKNAIGADYYVQNHSYVSFKKNVGPIQGFNGEGWYKDQHDTVLVIRVPDGEDSRGRCTYDFYVWNDPNGQKLAIDTITSLLQVLLTHRG